MSRGRYFIPQSGARIRRSGGTRARPARIRVADLVHRLDGRVAEIDHAQDDGLAGEIVEDAQVEPGLGGLDRDLRGVVPASWVRNE